MLSSAADSRVSTDPLQYIEGRGKLVDAHTVDVGGKRITARHILSELQTHRTCRFAMSGMSGTPRSRTLPFVSHTEAVQADAHKPACSAASATVGGPQLTPRPLLATLACPAAVATGARAFVPKFEGSEHCVISDNALEIQEVRFMSARVVFAQSTISSVGG